MDNYSNIGSFDGCGQVRPPHFHHPTAQRFQHSRGPQGPACEEGSPGNFRHFQKVQDYGRRRLQVLSKDEFTKAMRECDIGLTGTELNILFNYFDTGNDGSINLEEFIQGIRDPMNKQRLSIVHQAFDVIDADGNGIVEVSEVINRYNATKHPDVIAGKKSANDIMKEVGERSERAFWKTSILTMKCAKWLQK